MSMWIILRGVVLLILLMLGISFKFGISGLLHQVITTIADRIRGWRTQKTSSALEDFICVVFVPDRNIMPCAITAMGRLNQQSILIYGGTIKVYGAGGSPSSSSSIIRMDIWCIFSEYLKAWLFDRIIQTTGSAIERSLSLGPPELQRPTSVFIRMTQVIVAPVISISSDTSEESVGSHAPRVILFGAIPAIIPVILEVPVVPGDPIVTPEEDYLHPAPDLPLVSPFLCSDDTEADGESEPAEQRPVSSSHDTLTPLTEFPLAPVVAPPGIRRRSATLIHPMRLSLSVDLILPILTGRVDSSSSSAPSDHSLSKHTPPDTTDADSSTPQRLVHRSLARTPRHSSSFERSLDSSSPFHRPSRKRCRFSTASVPSPTYVSRLIAPTPADLLPPRKSISEGVVAHPEDGVGMGFKIAASDVREDDEEFEVKASVADTREITVDPLVIGDSSKSSRGGIPDLEDTIYDIVHYMSEVRIDMIIEIKTTQRQLETSQMVASGERASLVERIGSLRLEYLKVRAMLSIERDRIDSIRWHMVLSQEEFRQVRRDRDDTRRRLRRLESYNGSDGDNGNGGNGDGENGNGENQNGGNGNPNENGRGVVELIRWFEKMEIVFHINNCPEKSQVKYVTCTLLNSALTWWNSHKRTIGTEAVFSMSLRELMKLMTERFQELTMMCTKMVPEKEDRVEKFIGGLPDNIQGNVIAVEPTKHQDSIRIANNLMDQKLKGYVVKNGENKKILEVNQRDNRGQQPPFKRSNVRGQNVARAYTARNNEIRPYNGPLPLCNKCKLHHEGPFTVRCRKCNKCGRQGHYRSNCPKLKDQNRRNKAGNKNGVGEARRKAYVLGGGDANPDSNVVK
ncbi:reverse transcriptase domain-containing protein, partial [Tanacetum coccineum]